MSNVAYCITQQSINSSPTAQVVVFELKMNIWQIRMMVECGGNARTKVVARDEYFSLGPDLELL